MASSHRPSRWLAPLALLAAMAAVWLVVSAYTGDSEGDKGSSSDSSQQERREVSEGGGSKTGGSTSATPQRKTYTVRPGDTLGLIAERTGVSVEELMQLNPKLDPNSLTVGQKIKLVE